MTNGPTLEPALEAKLKRLRLRLEPADQDTLVLKNVPASPRHFNKASTNLLVKRPTVDMLCVVCVDEDLEYTGADRLLASTFAAGLTQQGWRVLTFGGCLQGDLTAALEYALGILETDGEPARAPTTPAVPRKGLLATWAEDLSDAAATTGAGLTLYRDEEMEQVAGCALGWHGRLALILGEAGAGKTNLVHGVAKMLARRNLHILSVNMGAIMAGTLFECAREALLMSLLQEARESGAVLALEQAEWAMMGVPRGPVLLREAMDRGVRLIATTTPEQAPRFLLHPLESRVEVTQLDELCPGDALRVLEVLRPSIAAHHGVQIDAEIERATVERSASMKGSLPGKAVGLLDAAAARASLAGNAEVSEVDLYLAASRMQVR
jgi:ATP-dependent Clp protease ATP-binding subunit ClpA